MATASGTRAEGELTFSPCIIEGLMVSVGELEPNHPAFVQVRLSTAGTTTELPQGTGQEPSVGS